MESSKKYFIGYQISNLAFQIFLIPFLYSNFELSDIGELVFLTAISQVVINFVSSGASILGVSRVDGVTTAEVFNMQLLISIISALLFYISCLFWVEEKTLSAVFSVYIIASGISLYWNYIFRQRFLKIFVANVISKISFILFILIADHNKINYAIAIAFEFTMFNLLLVTWELDSLKFNGIKQLVFKNYLKSSSSRMLSYFSLQFDKIVVGSVFGSEVLAIYNFIYKLAEVPANLLIQFNHIFMSRVDGKGHLPKVYAISSSLAFAMLLVFSDLISVYITGNNIDIREYQKELLFLCVLVSTRVYFEYLSFKNFYRHSDYIYPGIIQIISVVPYCLFFIYELDFHYFCLMVTISSVAALLMLEVRFISEFNFMFIALLLPSYIGTSVVFLSTESNWVFKFLCLLLLSIVFLKYFLRVIKNAE